MLKLVGAALVVAAGASFGVMSAQKLRFRVKCLRCLIAALDIMRAEICTRLTPIPELLELLARQCEEPAGTFFADCLTRIKTARGKSFGDIWLSALTEAEALNLRPPETEALGELAPVLGRYDPEQQEDAINKARKRLETFLAKAESECDREGKTRIALGIASGAAAAILLI